MRVGLWAVAAVSAVIAVSGCSTESTGKALPESAPAGSPSGIPEFESGSSTSPSSKGKAAGGIDLSKYAANPCGLLTAAQVAGLGTMDAPEPGKTGGSPSCVFNPKDVTKGARYTVVLPDETFAKAVRFAESSSVKEETTVGGLEAFTHSPIAGGKGRCTTIVAASAETTFQVLVGVTNSALPEAAAACEKSQEVAALVVETAKG
ncbi:DUF3558 domain-containing protein [Actinosynnema pretiosum subsp. pretiosum]|uniref:DUF3558 domain-containing protein n=2 Tax=Actinosynnema TaxID=40566 RepID=C6WI88_ACTMD|nr:DUF3558 family protein [Actinosynnema mirum]ACU36131.1 hypothetical protein Amir_2186 [Actinosynnema mirum DSM 43827]QUF06184.1 DUF3558 domain-containing protein [Actinosynnema pretiosum subsp. pretiosum]